MADDDKNKDKEFQVTFTKTMEDVNKTMTMLAQGMRVLNTSVEALKAAPKQETKKAKTKTIFDLDGTEEEEVDLESLPRKDLIKLILKGTESIIESKIGGVTSKLTEKEEREREEEGRLQIKDARKHHKDLDEWKEELIALAKKNPLLSIEEAYQLARINNPDKCKTLEEKMLTPEEKKTREETAKKEQDRKDKGEGLFGGLLPTSGTSTESSDLESDQAAELAWQKVVGGKDITPLTDQKK